MRELKNHPSPDQLDSYDKYPCYYENDLELVYTSQQSIFTLWAPSRSEERRVGKECRSRWSPYH